MRSSEARPAMAGVDNSLGELSKPPHVLVVGGTGMLQGVSIFLARKGYVTSVIGRDKGRFEGLIRQSASLSGQINPLIVNYRQTRVLAAILEDAMARLGPITLVVAWIHSSAPSAVQIVADTVARQNEVRFFEVKSSSSLDPAARLTGLIQSDLSNNLLYREIHLGFHHENGISRWLTHDEICEGVISAIEADRAISYVGSMHPRSLRPGANDG